MILRKRWGGPLPAMLSDGGQRRPPHYFLRVEF